MDYLALDVVNATMAGLRQAKDDAPPEAEAEIEALAWWTPDWTPETERPCPGCGVPAAICTLFEAEAVNSAFDAADAAGFEEPGWSKFDADLAEVGGSITVLFEKDMADPNWPYPPNCGDRGSWGVQIDRAIFAKWDDEDYARVLTALARQREAIQTARERAEAQEAQALARTVQAEPVETPPPDWLREATTCVLTAAPPAGERGLVA